MITECEAPGMNGVVFLTGTGERRDLIATGERSESKVLATPGLGGEIQDIINYAFYGMGSKTTYTGRCGHLDYHWHENFVKIVYIPDFESEDIPEHWRNRDAKEFMNVWMSLRGAVFPKRFTIGLHLEGNTCRANRRFTLLATCEIEDYAWYWNGIVFFKLKRIPQYFAMLELQGWNWRKFLTLELDYSDVLDISRVVVEASRKDGNLISFLKNYFFLPRTERELKGYTRAGKFSHIVWRVAD